MGTQSFIHAIPNALAVHVKRRKRVYSPVLLGVLLGALGAFLFLSPPGEFPKGTTFSVTEDVSFGEVATALEEEHIVRSAFLLKAFARVTGADKNLVPGPYLFESPIGLTSVLYRLSHGVSGIPLVRVTFIEGASVKEMSRMLESALSGFSGEEFLTEAIPLEGRLFPDTYFFEKDVTPSEVIEVLHTTYKEKTAHLDTLFAASSLTEEEVLVLASILEKEARTKDVRRTIAGILLDRLSIGMALQVDAVFGYIYDRETFHPSGEELEVDSPYNTYLYPGLPPGPIGNPGLEAIEAALTPIESDYLYYLTGTDGEMRYAKTFEEHKKNKELYLR